jgi:hydrogenase maturation protease
MAARILVAGIGNIFLGDDGFGSEVVRNTKLPQDDPNVRVLDYGIRGMHLAYDLLEEWDTLVLVDAIPSRGEPGTLHVFQADHQSDSDTTGLDAHGIEEGMGLTEPVAKAVPRAARAVEEIVAALRIAAPSAASWQEC